MATGSEGGINLGINKEATKDERVLLTRKVDWEKDIFSVMFYMETSDIYFSISLEIFN